MWVLKIMLRLLRNVQNMMGGGWLKKLEEHLRSLVFQESASVAQLAGDSGIASIWFSRLLLRVSEDIYILI